MQTSKIAMDPSKQVCKYLYYMSLHVILNKPLIFMSTCENSSSVTPHHLTLHDLTTGYVRVFLKQFWDEMSHHSENSSLSPQRPHGQKLPDDWSEMESFTAR